MKLFLEYLKYHIKSIGMLLGFSVIFTGVFLLYHLPPGAVFHDYRLGGGAAGMRIIFRVWPLAFGGTRYGMPAFLFYSPAVSA